MQKSRYTFLLAFLASLVFAVVESDILYDVLNKDDPCEDSCDKMYPSSLRYSPVKYVTCCKRGCRFFNLVHMVEEKKSDVNATRKQCEASCMEAYALTMERYACTNGCASMSKQRQSDIVVSQISWAVYVEDGNSVLMVQQPAGDFEPDDVLTDPGLRRQLERDLGLRDDDNRLPETRIRTLPADQELYMERVSRVNVTSWLDCMSRKSGLPRVGLGGLMLVAILLALVLCLAPVPQPGVAVPIDDDVKLLPAAHELPPKYSLHVEQV